MSAIKTTFGAGGAGLQPSGHGDPSLATALRDIATDLAALHAAFVALTAKLDADTALDESDYAATLDPDALLTTAP